MKPQETQPQKVDNQTGAVRVVSLRLSNSEAERARNSANFVRSVDSFLESEVSAPFHYQKVTPTAFAFNGKCTPCELDSFVGLLQDRMLEFLFGTDRDQDGQVLFFAGSDIDVARFVSASDEDAVRMADAFHKALHNRIQNSGVKTPPPTPVEGLRNLLYRGILLCPRKVMLAYAITPESHESQIAGDGHKSDIDLGRYLDFRGREAIDFSIRILAKISEQLQTASEAYKKSVLVLPLAYNSLMSRQDREKFYAALKEHPDWVRNNMILSVFNCPAQPGSTILQRFAAGFSPLFRTIDWQISDPDFDLSVLAGCQFHSVTLDTYTIPDKYRDKTISKFLNRIPEMKHENIRPAISGVRDRLELADCITAGMIYASGDAITATLPGYAPAQLVDMNDLPIMEPTILDLGSKAA